jgi:hypothetical protein
MTVIKLLLLVVGLALVAGSAHTRGRRETLDRPRVGVSLPVDVISVVVAGWFPPYSAGQNSVVAVAISGGKPTGNYDTRRAGGL